MREIRFFPRATLKTLLGALGEHGFRVVGPIVRDGAVQYCDLVDADDLPAGWTDDQAPGRYRLVEVDSPRCFSWAVGPQALKPLLFQPREVLWRARRDGAGRLEFTAAAVSARPVALIGARACDLAALQLHDRHFLGKVRDSGYAARRAGLFIVAVHCTHPASTCFCASTGDGPRATSGFDLALSELDEGYLLEIGTDAGRDIASRLPLQAADPTQIAQAAAAIRDAADQQSRSLPGSDLSDTLFARLEHPRWDQVAERCLSCGNCTSVCPTCFCSAEHEVPELGGAASEHVRDWDSCFSQGHSYLHGLVVRPATRHRYRQWLTHKLGSWHAQFGRSGCVGCGRCITWCPVGIDITQEAAAICARDDRSGESA